MGFELLIFDLDGTLIDTREDITRAVNEMLVYYKLPEKKVWEVTGLVGDGILKLVERCVSDKNININEAVEVFKDNYKKHMLDTTKPYPGITEVLSELSDKTKAVLTNKAFSFSKAILDGLNLTPFFDIIVGGDTLPVKKPNPDGLKYILQKTGISKSRAVMIGDGKNDMLTAKKVGISSIFVTYGFYRLNKNEINSDFIINDPREILLICSGN